MRSRLAPSFVTLCLLVGILAGCDKLDLGSKSPQSAQLPSARALRTVRYMSQAPGPNGRRIFDHIEQAKSCRDLETAMRWNRPPDIAGGPFNKKMIYLSSAIPGNLAQESEVFIVGVIERGERLSSGSSGWSLKMKDGSEVQAIETNDYWQRQEQLQQEGGSAAIVMPYTRGRTLCGYGIYQGLAGRALNGNQPVPLISILFAMDRRR